MLTLWSVSIPVSDDDDDDEVPVHINNTPKDDKKKLKATTKLSKVFGAELPEDTIHIIVQRPSPGNVALLLLHSLTAHEVHCSNLIHTPVHSDIVQTPIAVPVAVRARSSTPFSDESRPNTPLSGKSANIMCCFLVINFA